jgi:protein-disulfide isomerase
VLGSATAAWSLALLLGPAAAAVKTVCGADDGGGCSALWRSAFAVTVQRTTGVSVAAWGVVWGLAGMALALVALVRVARHRTWAAAVTGLRCLSAAGLLMVFVLAGVAFSERTFCKACAVVYALVAVHAGIALVGWRARRLPDLPRGTMMAASLVLGAYVVTAFLPAAPLPLATVLPQAPPPDASQDAALREFVSSLSAPARQALSDVLDRMRNGPALTLPAPRALRGSPDAPVRFTEFTDVRCSHCAELHHVWAELERALPVGTFSLESRFYPLDAGCNSLIRSRAADPVRCLAPRVEICLEDRAGGRELAGALFAEQRTLTTERVYALASAHLPRAQLEECAASPETARKLADDVALAGLYEPEGTPVVLVNGREGAAFPPFLYAIVVARGWPDHPAFASLPSPRPGAHIH